MLILSVIILISQCLYICFSYLFITFSGWFLTYVTTEGEGIASAPLGNEGIPEFVLLRLCIEERLDIVESPDAIDKVILGAGLGPIRRLFILDTSSVVIKKCLITFYNTLQKNNVYIIKSTFIKGSIQLIQMFKSRWTILINQQSCSFIV